jgi:uncharacterized protein YgbK (DUF1537 family)
LPSIRSALVVSGSSHDASLRQIARAQALGWPVRAIERIPQSISESFWLVLDSPMPAGASGGEHTANLGALARDAIRSTKLDAVIVFGGDTAYGMVQALGFPPLHPIGEVLPGIPVSRLDARDLRSEVGERDRDLILITKAGGFGGPDLLGTIRERMTGK